MYTHWSLQFIPPKEIELFNKIKADIEKMTDIDFGKGSHGQKIELSCYMLARAVGEKYSLQVIDGYYKPPMDNYYHSWVVTPTGNIIDVYPVAIVSGPYLMTNHSLGPASKLYVPSEDAAKEIEKDVKLKSFQKALQKLVKALS